MNRRSGFAAWLGAALLAAAALPAAAPAQTAGEGERLFARMCAGCHTVIPGAAHRLGPNLLGIYGAPAARAPGFRYSPALAQSGIVWTAETLDQLLTDSQRFLPRTTMIYRQRDPAVRAAIIEFLKARTAAARAPGGS